MGVLSGVPISKIVLGSSDGSRLNGLPAVLGRLSDAMQTSTAQTRGFAGANPA